MGTSSPHATRAVPGILAVLLAVLLLAGLPGDLAAPAAAATGSRAGAVTAAATTGRSGTGPALRVPRAELRASLTCSGPLRGPHRPVLLVHGTTFTAATNFDWNYEPALERAGRAWCAVDLPSDGMADAARAAEHVTWAVRRMHSASGRRVDVVGYSQGGMLPRWSLRWWPGLRRKVGDVVGIDPSNYGTLDSELLCQVTCPPSFWQQATGSRFLAALNAGPDRFAGIDYTVVYTLTDEVVTPNLPPEPASGLRDGPGSYAEVAVQDLCPLHLADHLSMGTTDPVGWAVVIDALRHRGPAVASRVPATTCLRDVMPGVDRARLPANLARAATQVATAVATSPLVRAEPPLPAYAR